MSIGPTINIQTKLGAPANIAAVANQIRRGLGGINADVKLNVSQDAKAKLATTGAALKEIQNSIIAINRTSSNLGNNFGKATIALKNLGTAGKEINSITVSTGKLNSNLDKTGNTIAAVTARFSAFVLVAQTFNKVAASVGEGVTEALDFQRELVRLKQVGDDTSVTIKSIGDQAISLGKKLGTSSNELIKVASTLRQAGLNANDTKLALETLAKTRLSPSFTDLNNTVEGAIAVIGQFKLQAKDLVGVFDSINSVSKAFAVESNDLVTGIRLAGAAFSQAGGDLNEFLAIFTAIRSQTRESAESIGTGLKTIFTRLQRKDSVDALKNLGVNLRDAKGEFVGVYEGIRRIGQGLSQINPRSQQFADIVEQIGGLRQVNKILPLITNQKTLTEALNVAKKSSNSLDRDAAVGQEALIVKLTKLKESFFEIFKILSENKQLLAFVDKLTQLGDAAVILVKKLEPIVPILATMAAIRIGSGVATVAKTLGKQALGFNTGGKVPGKSHGDVQPIMAEGGEFIIKKRAAQKIGYDALERLNHGGMLGFASGGEVIKNISASFAQTSIGSQKDFDAFIREQIDKVYKGQGRPRGDRGLYIKKDSFEQMLREALGGGFKDTSSIPSFSNSARTVLSTPNRPNQANLASYGPVAAAYNTRPSGPSGFGTIFDSASITRQSKTEEVVKAIKEVAKNTNPTNPVVKQSLYDALESNSFNSNLNPSDVGSGRRSGKGFIGSVRNPEVPFDINLNDADPFSRNRTPKPVSIARNPELPFNANLNPDDGSGRYRGFGATVPINPNRGPELPSEIGLGADSGRARNRIKTNNIPLVRNLELPFDIGLDAGAGRARNRFNKDVSVAQTDPFGVIKTDDIKLSNMIYRGKRVADSSYVPAPEPQGIDDFVNQTRLSAFIYRGKRVADSSYIPAPEPQGIREFVDETKLADYKGKSRGTSQTFGNGKTKYTINDYFKDSLNYELKKQGFYNFSGGSSTLDQIGVNDRAKKAAANAEVAFPAYPTKYNVDPKELKRQGKFIIDVPGVSSPINLDRDNGQYVDRYNARTDKAFQQRRAEIIQNYKSSSNRTNNIVGFGLEKFGYADFNAMARAEKAGRKVQATYNFSDLGKDLLFGKAPKQYLYNTGPDSDTDERRRFYNAQQKIAKAPLIRDNLGVTTRATNARIQARLKNIGKNQDYRDLITDNMDYISGNGPITYNVIDKALKSASSLNPGVLDIRRRAKKNPFSRFSKEDQVKIYGAGNSNNIREVQSLYQGKGRIDKEGNFIGGSAAINKYQKTLGDVTGLLALQVQALQKGKVKEEQYNKIKEAAAKALQDNIKVFTSGNGKVKGLVGNSLAQSLVNPSFGQRFGASFQGVRDAINFRQKPLDNSFSGLGSFYANPGNFFASDGSTKVNPATAFAGLSSDGTVAGNKTAAAGSRGSRLKGVGKLAGTAALLGLLSYAGNSSNNDGFLGSFGRVGGQALNGGFIGGSAGGLAGSVFGPVGGVGLGVIGTAVGAIGGLGKGIYDEITRSQAGPSGADIKNNILNNDSIKAYIGGELSLGGVGKDSANRTGASNPIYRSLVSLNNISKGELNKLKLGNRVGVTNYGNGEDDATVDYINKFKQNDIRGIKDGGRQLAESLFQDRLRTGAVTSKNFDQYSKTDEFRQITEALNTTVGTKTQEIQGQSKVRDTLRQQVLEMEKEKNSRTEMLAVYDKEQQELNKLNFAYSKTLDQLNRFFDGLGRASEKLNDSFNDASFNAAANLGEGGTQPFKFKVSDFGPQGAALQQLAGKGGVLENLKESLPSLIETAIQTEKNNPNIGFADALKIGLNQKGFDQSITDNVVARAKSDPKIATEYLNGKAPEVLNSLLKSFEPFTESFKRLQAEGEDAGRKLAQALSQYAENIVRLNEGLNNRDQLALGTSREFARQESFDAVNRTPTDFLSLAQLQAPFTNNQRRLTGLDNASPQAISDLLGQKQQDLLKAQGENDAVEIQKAQSGIQSLVTALKNLTDTSKSAAGVQEKLSLAEDRFNKVRESVLSSTEKFILAGPNERRQIINNRGAAQAAAVVGLNGLPGGALGRNAQNALAGLDELGNQPIFVGNAQVGVQQRRNRAGRAIGRPRPVIAPQFLPANEVKQGLLGQVGGVGLAQNNPEIAALRELLNKANVDAVKAQDVLNKNLQDTNTKFIADLRAMFADFFGGVGGRAPINFGVNQPALPNNLQNRRNPGGRPNPLDILDNPNANLKQINFAGPGGQQDNSGILGTFNDLTVKLNQLNTTLGQLNIPSEIKVTLNTNPIPVQLTGMEILAQFSKEIQGLIMKSIAEEFNKRAAQFVNNIPPKI